MKPLQIIAMTLLSTLLSTADATPPRLGISGYTDHIQVSSEGTAKPHIIGDIAAEGEITVSTTGNASFDIHDKSGSSSATLGSSGTATVTFGLNADDYCVLKITDGAYQPNPSDEATCYGKLIYKGMGYDGTFSYKYYLIFDTQ